MSMSGNPHYENAKTAGHEDGGDIEATLALAYEQRTGNLIALMAWLAQHGRVSAAIAAQVDERLGLK